MKILHIVHYFLPHQGGEERYAYHLGQELIKRGHEVWIATSNLPECPAREMMSGIRVIRHRAIATLFRNPITLGMLLPRKYLRGFDLIHTQGEYSFATNAAVFLKLYLHIPLVMTCYGHVTFGNPFVDMVERLYSATIGKMTVNSADKVIVLSSSTKQDLQALGVNQNKIAVIPTGIDLQKWVPYLKADTSSFLSKYQLGGGRIILFIGAITERKGIKYLVEALPRIIKNHPDVVCLFVGDGDYRKKAERLVSKLNLERQARFAGYVPDEELALAYKSCHIYVLPSLSEGLPATILEAFVFSKPVVTTNIDSIRGYFKGTALLVPPRDSDELASAIAKVLAEPELGRKMSEKGKRLLESGFTWQQHVESLLAVYEEVTQKG